MYDCDYARYCLQLSLRAIVSITNEYRGVRYPERGT